MSRDGKLLTAARNAFAERKNERERELGRREREVFAINSRAKNLSDEIHRTMRELFAAALNPETDARAVEDIESRNLELQAQLRRETASAGFPEGYLDDVPYCEKCGDTGYNGTELCECLEELYREEQTKALSHLLTLGDASFDSFRLDYYDGEAREQMQRVFLVCTYYAETFGGGSDNLFLTGAPGLGKTFLSACIARVVAASGASVVYDTFTSIFAKLEDEKFRRDDEDTQPEETRRLRECDLLIADDLGTEMTTAFTTSALYELINTRLIRGKKTIISSNLTPAELYRRYTPQIASRLEGEYFALNFVGSDIRLKKREIL
ncbi:MAG: ATP-binding protein [Oscillospiraceae bacterium]|jgi:DNA replication protein DnaC|nr:ATP-binding protein [Oscillospiraceae bacterium]